MANPEYFVIDGSGLVSFDIHTEQPESFGTFAEAQKRARELAKSEPHHTVVIARSIAFVTAEVSPRKVEMRERRI